MSDAPSVLVIWDYDTALGQINSTFPYNFREEAVLQEIANVDRLLSELAGRDVRMTFACVGFAAEPGQFPYHVPEQLRRIRAAGHEIASHSWRHEWFPLLQREQVRRSLARSKAALEECLGEPGAVRGFVPPFSRPMSWYRKGAVSLGDRVRNPLAVAADIGALCRELGRAGYAWCRVAHRSLAQRIRRARFRPLIDGRLEREAGVACVPQHCTGFGDEARELLDRAVALRRSVTIVAHPHGLTLGRGEDFAALLPFLDRIEALQREGRVRARTVDEHLRAEGGR